jgi:hypothetical protein
MKKNYSVLESNNWIYEDAPDPRDGAVPGCSSDNNSTTTDSLLQEDSSSESNNANQSTVDNIPKVPTKRRKVRSHEAITLRYADKLKENYEEVQNNIMEKNRCFIERLMESEKQLEKEIINNMLESQQKMLRDTTNQLLTGLQNIFAPQISSQFSTVSVPTVNSAAQSPFVMSPVRYSSPFPNLESQTFRSSSPFPKVLLNLRSPTPEKLTTASVEKIVSIKKHPQTDKEKPIQVQSLVNVKSQNSQN